MPAVIKYPLYQAKKNGGFIQNFPFRTLNMVITLISIVVGSFIARALFKYCLSKRFDVAGDFKDGVPDIECSNIINVKGMCHFLFISILL